MNKTVAFIGLGAAVCMTAPAFAQDTHLSLTKQSVASMHEITAALDKVTDEPGAADAVKTVKKVREKLVDLGKRQLELPGATPQEQAQISAQMTEVQKISGELVKSLARLKKEGLLTPDLQKALMDLQSVQTELAQAEPFPKDAEGNTHETLLAKTVDEVKKLDDSLSRVKDEETSKAAVNQIGHYRAALLDIAKKQAALPPLTRNQQAKLTGVQQQLVEMMQPIVKHVTAIMLSPDASKNLKEALNSLSELPKEVQKIREEAAK
ncbi:hypothetical protein ABGM91_04445 [Akkermansia muciniphila]|uniref:hypothetical protein n=1 Tax=Akkermansia muciniphila TaxID=239935 RepID=UPI0033BD6C48